MIKSMTLKYLVLCILSIFVVLGCGCGDQTSGPAPKVGGANPGSTAPGPHASVAGATGGGGGGTSSQATNK